jgi:hypothetical protein
VLSVVGDIPINSGCGDFVNLEIWWRSLSEVLIGVRFVYMYS